MAFGFTEQQDGCAQVPDGFRIDGMRLSYKHIFPFVLEIKHLVRWDGGKAREAGCLLQGADVVDFEIDSSEQIGEATTEYDAAKGALAETD